MDEKTRFLIIGTGRSGSSLLSAILHDAGAAFRLSGVADWDPVKGAYEHPDLHLAYHWQSRAQKIAQSLWPDRLGRHACEHRADAYLSGLLDRATYVKSTTLVWLVARIHKLGYTPRIVVSFRTFAAYCASRFLKFGWSMARLSDVYIDTYATALLQLGIFGGCVVDYADMVDVENRDWAKVLAELTGLDEHELLDARQRRLRPAERHWPEELVPVIDPVVRDLDDRLRALKNQLIVSEYF